MRTDERGNALWFILVAIVLLGVLTMVLGRSGSSTSQSGDVEQQRVRASQLMRYAKNLESTIEKMILNGISENEIGFQNTVTSLVYTNTSCDAASDPNYPGCRVFDAAGAGQTVFSLPGSADFTGAGDPVVFIGGINVAGVGTDTAGSGEELLFVHTVDQDLCARINRDLGVSVSGAVDITVNADDWSSAFSGSFSDLGFTIGGVGAGNAPALSGRTSGCAIDDHGTPFFYQVLIAR